MNLGRLTNALYDNGTCVSYQYDPSGNRTSQNITASGPANSPNWGAGVWGCFRWTHQ
jgi:YD repeat-containing protein